VRTTQNQLIELLGSDAAKAMVETGEERGWIESAELEAFALDHELADSDIEDLTRELERIGLEVRDERPRQDDHPEKRRKPTRSSMRLTNPRVQATASSSFWLMSGATNS